MQKLVTFVPKDPTLVLALKITELTWNYFLKLLTAGGYTLPVDKNKVLGSYIVVPIDSEATWGWMSKSDFNEFYQADEDWLEHRFTNCHAIKQ